MEKSKELTPENEAEIKKLQATIEELNAKIKAKLLDTAEKNKYKLAIKILKAKIKKLQRNEKVLPNIITNVSSRLC